MDHKAKRDYSQFKDEELMALFQTGFNSAFDEIFSRYQKSIFYRMISNGRSKQDCEDLVQETFLCVSRFRHTYSPELKFSPWLFKIAKNLSITQYRKSKHLVTTCMASEPVDMRVLQDMNLHQANLMFSTRIAIEQLSPQFSHLLALRVIHGFTYKEISKISGVPIGTVKSRIGRGRVRLRKSLKVYEDC